jgi:hypothetical protein
MTQFTINDETRARLLSAGTPVELCDVHGGRVGYFLSDDEYHRLMFDWARAVFAAEEIDHSPPAEDDLSTAKAIAHLEVIARQGVLRSQI